MSTALKEEEIPEVVKNARHGIFSYLPLFPIENDKDYRERKKLLLSLMRKNRESEELELTLYIRQLASLMKGFEEQKYGQSTKVSGVRLLAFLMEQNGLTQSDLVDEIGPQGNVSKILSGQRGLNLSQVKKLSARFKISSDAFIK